MCKLMLIKEILKNPAFRRLRRLSVDFSEFPGVWPGSEGVIRISELLGCADFGDLGVIGYATPAIPESHDELETDW